MMRLDARRSRAHDPEAAVPPGGGKLPGLQNWGDNSQHGAWPPSLTVDPYTSNLLILLDVTRMTPRHDGCTGRLHHSPLKSEALPHESALSHQLCPRSYVSERSGLCGAHHRSVRGPQRHARGCIVEQ